jgi:dienelactone hydrolase
VWHSAAGTALRRLQALLPALALSAAGPAAASYETAWVEFTALEKFNGDPVELSALMYRPPGTGPFPALVLMHGCGGLVTNQGYVTASYRHWAELLALEGYVALLVDSFGPRGYRSICELQVRPIRQSRERADDIYAAREWLAAQSYVARDRIGVIGWSNGASGTLYGMRESRPRRGIRAAVAFYPGCRTLARSKTPYRPYAPLLILAGEADDWTPAQPCVELVEIARKQGAAMEIVTYPGAHHSFDRINSPVRYRPNVRNLNQHDRKGATAGEHPEARKDAIRRTLAFFALHLKN